MPLACCDRCSAGRSGPNGSHGRRSATPLALNYPVQASAADLLLVALAKVDRALTSRIDAEITLSVHDEIVIEAAEDDAEDARDRLVEAMLEAWAEVFPDAPDTGIVDCKIVRAWDNAK
jgi:DNA polymerase I-like protein with 3'-5' exonuclease and polymerase domains